jgi:2-polyprenyl-3-methyl-5-hydroxy-6-metoxy-1,4-benzoquinol methylase
LGYDYFQSYSGAEQMTDEIIRHYTELFDEDSRLENRIGPFEYERTTEIIARYLDRPSQVVVDVGGGTGVYALWLAEQGHEVHFMDLVPRHVDMVTEKARERLLTLGSPGLVMPSRYRSKTNSRI